MSSCLEQRPYAHQYKPAEYEYDAILSALTTTKAGHREIVRQALAARLALLPYAQRVSLYSDTGRKLSEVAFTMVSKPCRSLTRILVDRTFVIILPIWVISQT